MRANDIPAVALAMDAGLLPLAARRGAAVVVAPDTAALEMEAAMAWADAAAELIAPPPRFAANKIKQTIHFLSGVHPSPVRTPATHL